MAERRWAGHECKNLGRIVGRGREASRGPKRKVGRGPIGECDAGLLVAIRHCRIGHAHERGRGARRHARHELWQVEERSRRCAKPGHFAGKKWTKVAFAFAPAQEFAPIVARDRADRFRNGNEPILLMVDLAIGFQAVVACAHAMQGDQDHRQVIGETKRKLPAPLPRPGDGPLESLLRGGGLMRRDGARRRRAHEILQCTSSCCYRIRRGLESASQSSPRISLASRRADNGPSPKQWNPTTRKAAWRKRATRRALPVFAVPVRSDREAEQARRPWSPRRKDAPERAQWARRARVPGPLRKRSRPPPA